jgi:predicted DNA-binding transcriptional regulator AlpA
VTARSQLSGSAESPAAQLLPLGASARRLGCSGRTVYRLVDRGQLPPPTMMAGRNCWRAEDIERVRQERLQMERPARHRHASAGAAVANRIRREHSIVARLLLDCLCEAGVVVVLDVLRRHGADARWRRLGIEQLTALGAELEAAARLARGLR